MRLLTDVLQWQTAAVAFQCPACERADNAHHLRTGDCESLVRVRRGLGTAMRLTALQKRWRPDPVDEQRGERRRGGDGGGGEAVLLAVEAGKWQRWAAEPGAIMARIGMSGSVDDVGGGFGIFEHARATAALRRYGVPRGRVDDLLDIWRRQLIGGWSRAWVARHPNTYTARPISASVSQGDRKRAEKKESGDKSGSSSDEDEGSGSSDQEEEEEDEEDLPDDEKQEDELPDAVDANIGVGVDIGGEGTSRSRRSSRSSSRHSSSNSSSGSGIGLFADSDDSKRSGKRAEDVDDDDVLYDYQEYHASVVGSARGASNIGDSGSYDD